MSSIETRRSLARSLAERSFQITECNDGRIGVDLLRNDQGFDLIFLDWQLADGSGLELLREIKGLGIPVPVVGPAASVKKAARTPTGSTATTYGYGTARAGPQGL